MSPQLIYNFLPTSFFILFLLLMIKSNGSITELGSNFMGCPSFICGGVTIAYPFWRLDGNTNTGGSSTICGYRGLGVNCSTMGNSPMFSPPAAGYPTNHYYRIRDINYDTQTLTLVDDDVADQICPWPRHNFTLSGASSSSLSFSELDLRLGFHFNCTWSSRFDNSRALEIPCLKSGAKRTYITRGDPFTLENPHPEFQQYCDERYVETWVLSNEINLTTGEEVGVAIGEAFGKGFLLQWTDLGDTQCIDCEKSGGRCGYPDSLDQNLHPAPYFSCFCPNGSQTSDPYCDVGSRHLLMKIMLGGVALLAVICFVIIIYCYRTKPSFGEQFLVFLGLRPKNDNNINIEAFITQYRFSTPRRYKYSEIKRMTNAFKDELGRGGFGSVFKGTLPDGSLVAIKVLNKSKGSGEDFINEVASIGRTCHVNIVALKGFCYDGPKRALVYEFMPNGSLEKFIFQNIPKDSEQYLRVEKLYEIALGIARGLEYLHRGCSTRILHFDIKPHNILLDEDFCPKISDFGLAKLHSSKESIMSMVEARGTIGYTAPEVFNRNFGGVSHKSDVYSYGMMVIEMVGGRKNLDVGVVHSSEIYFPQWIYKRLELNEDLQLQQGPMTAVENEIARKMIIVGLWCIQADPSQRPSMNKMIEMLVGSTEVLTVPPNPFFSSPPQPPASSSSATLESTSSEETLQIAE